MSDSISSALTAKQRWAYALPALALALPTLPFYVLLPVFYADITRLTLAQVGGWLMLARLADVLSDILAARLCDHPLGWMGRKGWMVAGAALAAPGLWALSSPPEGAGAGWLFGSSVLLYSGLTLIQIPYTAWIVSLGNTPRQRVDLSSRREALGVIGLVLSASWPAMGAWLGWSTEQVFRYLAITALLWGALSLLWMLKSLPQPGEGGGTSDDFEWRSLFVLPHQRRLMLVWWTNGLANAVAAVLFPLVISDWLLLDDSHRGAFLLVYFLAALMVLPLWKRLVTRVLLPRVWCWAMLLAIAALASLPLLPPSSVTYMVVVIITGATLGADLVLPHSIQAAVVSWEQRQHGRFQPALHYAGASLVIKLSLGIGVGLAPLLLSIGGWQDGVETQSAAAQWSLIVIYSWLPCVLKGVAVALMWGFPDLDKQSASQID
ncbi:MAG: GPH family glycoside/pentoside/hexuronide:cation symporter [Motiliproteus sp.]|jgi:GPH family glycoside/pentoside/hexuronide:cation symporter